MSRCLRHAAGVVTLPLGSLGLCRFGIMDGIPLVAFLIGMTWNLPAVVLADKNSRPHVSA